MSLPYSDGIICSGCGKAELESNAAFKRCCKCKEQNIIPACFCSLECFQLYWPEHKAWHKQNEEQAASHAIMEERSFRTYSDREKVLTSIEERSSSPYSKQLGRAMRHLSTGNPYTAAKASRKAIDLDPFRIEGYVPLGMALEQSNDKAGAARCFLAAVALAEAKGGKGTPSWAFSVASAFNKLTKPEASEVERPSWWNDSTLLTYSKLVVQEIEELGVKELGAKEWSMRGYVLEGFPVGAWPGQSTRSVAQLHEAAQAYQRAAALCPPAEEYYTARSTAMLKLAGDALPCGYRVGEVLHVISPSLFFPDGPLMIPFGSLVKVSGPISKPHLGWQPASTHVHEGLAVLLEPRIQEANATVGAASAIEFANIDHKFLSRTPPPPLAGGYTLGERVYYILSSHNLPGSGIRLECGQAGLVMGPDPADYNGGVAVQFQFFAQGDYVACTCMLAEISRIDPRTNSSTVGHSSLSVMQDRLRAKLSERRATRTKSLQGHVVLDTNAAQLADAVAAELLREEEAKIARPRRQHSESRARGGGRR